MKSTTLKTITRTILIAVITIAAMFSFSSCATKAKFAISTVAPAARGDVKVTKDKNKNYEIKIEIYNLAEVERLQPAKNTYVVWLVSEQDETKNLGKLKSSTNTFSNNLKASFDAVTSTKPTKIFITAEDNASIVYPSGQVVITTNRF